MEDPNTDSSPIGNDAQRWVARPAGEPQHRQEADEDATEMPDEAAAGTDTDPDADQGERTSEHED